MNFAEALKGQTHDILTITSKADKIFIDTVGDNFKVIKAKAYGVRTTDNRESYYTLSLHDALPIYRKSVV